MPHIGCHTFALCSAPMAQCNSRTSPRANRPRCQWPGRGRSAGRPAPRSSPGGTPEPPWPRRDRASNICPGASPSKRAPRRCSRSGRSPLRIHWSRVVRQEVVCGRTVPRVVCCQPIVYRHQRLCLRSHRQFDTRSGNDYGQRFRPHVMLVPIFWPSRSRLCGPLRDPHQIKITGQTSSDEPRPNVCITI